MFLFLLFYVYFPPPPSPFMLSVALYVSTSHILVIKDWVRFTLKGGVVVVGGSGHTNIGRPTYAHTQMEKWYSGMMVMWCDVMSHTVTNPPQLKLCTIVSIIDQTASHTNLHVIFIWCCGLNETNTSWSYILTLLCTLKICVWFSLGP